MIKPFFFQMLQNRRRLHMKLYLQKVASVSVSGTRFDRPQTIWSDRINYIHQ